jgi:hypothetical protein
MNTHPYHYHIYVYMGVVFMTSQYINANDLRVLRRGCAFTTALSNGGCERDGGESKQLCVVWEHTLALETHSSLRCLGNVYDKVLE